MQQVHKPVVPNFVIAALAVCASIMLWDVTSTRSAQASTPTQSVSGSVSRELRVRPADAHGYVEARWQDDLEAMKAYRPGYSFWQHVFTIADGHIAYGSAVDGRLLAYFPTTGDWARQAVWADPSLANTLDDVTLPTNVDERRELVASLIEEVAGPVLQNPTRGQFLAPNAQRYGIFIGEWSEIYARFGVPPEIGLAQAILESGWNGNRKSKAKAVGFCQWLAGNWKVLDRLAPNMIEAQNQTTQAPYCAAYLTILATRHGSFIPALSEHHSGGTNVGRTLINGARLGGASNRERYFMGAQFARDLRTLGVDTYKDLYRSYGPRSYFYAEMAFGNTFKVQALRNAIPQKKIYAMRTSRPVPIAEIRRRTFLSEDEIRRYNPALVKKVPAGADIYLPVYVKELGRDVTFWHVPASKAFTSLLNEFIRLDEAGDQWGNPSFANVLRDFERRFAATRTEEGAVMATVLAYSIQEMYSSGRGAILSEFRNSEHIRALFERGQQERESARAADSGFRALLRRAGL